MGSHPDSPASSLLTDFPVLSYWSRGLRTPTQESMAAYLSQASVISKPEGNAELTAKLKRHKFSTNMATGGCL